VASGDHTRGEASKRGEPAAADAMAERIGQVDLARTHDQTRRKVNAVSVERGRGSEGPTSRTLHTEVGDSL